MKYRKYARLSIIIRSFIIKKLSNLKPIKQDIHAHEKNNKIFIDQKR